MRLRLIPVVMLLLAPQVWADSQADLEKAKALVGKKQYAEALKVLDAAAAGTPLDLTLSVLEMKGVALALANRGPEARSAFELLLSLSPDRTAPSAGGAKAAQAHDQAKKLVAANGALAFVPGPAEAAHGVVKRLVARVPTDPMKASRKIQFSSRVPPASHWETVVVPLTEGRAQVQVEGASVEWFASLLGDRDAELARIGSAAAPQVEKAAPEVAAAAPQPAPAASPPPADARATDAVVFSVAPIQVVVLQPREIGGAEQGALVAEEIARALPSSAFKVTTFAQLQAVIGLERQKQLLGCGEDSNSCLAELANALGADVVVASTLAKTSDGLRCNVSFLSGGNGNALERVNVESTSDGQLYSRLNVEVSEAAARLFAGLRPGAKLEPGRPGVRRYAWAPAAAAVALGGAAAAMFVVSGNTARTLQSRQGLLESTSSAYALASSGRTTETLAWVFAGTGAVALAAASLMFTVGAPTEPKVVLVPMAGVSSGGVMISGVFP
jgi:hypothetical protein